MDKGTKVNANNAKLYSTYDTKISSSIVNGIYWIYNSVEKNNRIRITDDKEKINVPCSMTGWVNISDIEVVDEDS